MIRSNSSRVLSQLLAVVMTVVLITVLYLAKTVILPLALAVDGMLTETVNAKPDIVCLSALPPYAISHARGIYRRLRARQPQLQIIIGLWNYPEDTIKAATEISGGEQKLVCTSLAEIILQASLASGVIEPLESAGQAV